MRFSELTHDLRDATVFLDIDGTLVGDKQSDIAPDALEKIRALAAHNDVYLSSNGDPFRAAALAKAAGVQALPQLRKPLPHAAVRSIERRERVVVIGDKFLTDGIFARLIGAEFIKVVRLRGEADDAFARFAYLLDDLVWHAAPYLQLMRPQQWVKNSLVFAPIFFAGAFFVPSAFIAALVCFVAFSTLASAVYVVNDLRDLEADREHPVKARRPLPSGTVSKLSAILLAIALTLVTCILLFLIPTAIPVFLVYALLNLAYTFSLKHVPVIDISLVASFYVLRVVAGGAAAAIALSPWIVLATFFVALFLVSGKRQGEFTHTVRRKVLDGYSEQMLGYLLISSAVLAIAFYGLWAIFTHPSTAAAYSTILVATVFFRMLNIMTTDPARAESPELLVFKDGWTFGLTVFWTLVLAAIFYLP
ncbi:MAG TPA: UbiA family prenyltransferase [Candidatus Paceibacterota bacterium]|nr:UbiA family prenyltransferase [Candidatus Paceibacterota bacterium]